MQSGCVMLSFEELVLEFEEAESMPTPSAFKFVESWLQLELTTLVSSHLIVFVSNSSGAPQFCNVFAASFLALGSE